MAKKEFTIRAFGSDHVVVCNVTGYVHGGLAITVTEKIVDDPDMPEGYEEPFGVLTVNMGGPVPEPNQAFVKTWSENEGWAKALAEAIGGRYTGVCANNGCVTAPLYEFDPEALLAL